MGPEFRRAGGAHRSSATFVCVVFGADENGEPGGACEHRVTGALEGFQAAIRTQAMTRSFARVNALNGLDLSVEKGEIYGFLGPNGAGKSTLVRVLCTLLRPTSGRGWVLGHDIVRDKWQVRRCIGVALQEAALDERQTGRELLRLQGRLYGLGGSAMRSRMSEVLDLVDIGSAIDRRISTYSGGMRRRLDLAAALVHDPQVLFLDEPTTGLDPHSRAAVWQEVRRLNRELGMTIFLTTQYLEEADELAHRVGIIGNGRLLTEGPPGELKRSVGQDVIVATVEGIRPEVLTAVAALDGATHVDSHPTATADSLAGGASDRAEVILRSDDGAALRSPLALTLERSGARVLNIVMRTPTLDDVFLEITGAHIRSSAENPPVGR